MTTPKKFFLLGFFFFLFGIFSWGIFQKTFATIGNNAINEMYSQVSKSGTYADSQNISAGDTLRVKNAIAVNIGNSDVKFKTDSFSLQNGNWVTTPFSTSKTISSEVKFFYTGGSTSSLSGNFSLDPRGNLVRLKISPISVANGNRDIWQYSANPSILENISDKTSFFSSTGASIGTQVGTNRQIYLEAQVEAVCTVPTGYTLSTSNAYNGNGQYVFQGENATATANSFANGTKTVTLSCGTSGENASISATNISCNTADGYEKSGNQCVLSNQPPIANNDSFTVDINLGIAELDILSNDSDPDTGDTISIQSVNAGSCFDADIKSGKIEISNFSSCSLNTDYSFNYTIRDSGTLTDSATVTVNFTASEVDLVAIDRENFSTDSIKPTIPS